MSREPTYNLEVIGPVLEARRNDGVPWSELEKQFELTRARLYQLLCMWRQQANGDHKFVYKHLNG